VTATRHEYRVSWRRPDRRRERSSRYFQFRKSAERFAARVAWLYTDVRLERRAVGEWHECRREVGQ
jgi:hypothetical protein